MNPASVFVIVPSFNEQAVLGTTIREILNYGYQVVMVDDGSAIPQKNYIDKLSVHCLTHEVNLGQGAALQTGTEYALKTGAEFIVHFDADGQHLASDIAKLLLPLYKDECDVVFGSRFLTTSVSLVPLHKKFLIHTARYLHSFFTGLLLTDAHNGLRALTKKAASLLTITENRMGHASELLFLIQQHGLRLKETGVTVLYTSYSLQKGQSSWNSIRIGFDLLLHKLFR